MNLWPSYIYISCKNLYISNQYCVFQDVSLSVRCVWRSSQLKVPCSNIYASITVINHTCVIHVASLPNINLISSLTGKCTQVNRTNKILTGNHGSFTSRVLFVIWDFFLAKQEKRNQQLYVIVNCMIWKEFCWKKLPVNSARRKPHGMIYNYELKSSDMCCRVLSTSSV